MNIFGICFRKFTSTPWWYRYSDETDSCEAGWGSLAGWGTAGRTHSEGSGWEEALWRPVSSHSPVLCWNDSPKSHMGQSSWTHSSASTTVPNPHTYPRSAPTQALWTRRDLMTPDHLGTQHQIILSSRLAFYAPIPFPVARQVSSASALLSLPIDPSFLFDLEFLHDL